MEIACLPLDHYGNGFKMLQKYGYDGATGLGLQQQGRLELVLPQENLKNQGLGYKNVTKITKERQRTLDILNKPSLALEYTPQNQLSTQRLPSSSHRSKQATTYPSTKSDGADLICLLQETNETPLDSTVPKTTSQANVVVDTGSPPPNVPNP